MRYKHIPQEWSRSKSRIAYLRPALERPNLSLRVKALATRIVFQGTRATGMEYVQRGTTHIAHAAREVILAGGVINTPQLLMLSGIGDPAELKAVGINALERLTHDGDVAGAVEGIVGAADLVGAALRQVDQMYTKSPPTSLGLAEWVMSKVAPLLLGVVDIDAHDLQP